MKKLGEQDHKTGGLGEGSHLPDEAHLFFTNSIPKYLKLFCYSSEELYIYMYIMELFEFNLNIKRTFGGLFTHSFQVVGAGCNFFYTLDTYPRKPPVTNTTMMYPRSSVKVNISIPMKDRMYTIRVVCLKQRQNN